MNSPRCNNVDIDWYINMPTDPLPGDLKVEMLPELCKEEDVTLEPTIPMKHSQILVLVKSNTILVSQIKTLAG